MLKLNLTIVHLVKYSHLPVAFTLLPVCVCVCVNQCLSAKMSHLLCILVHVNTKRALVILFFTVPASVGVWTVSKCVQQVPIIYALILSLSNGLK